MKIIKRCVFSFLLLFGLWILLTGVNDKSEIITGLILTCFLSTIFWRNNCFLEEFTLAPKTILYVIVYPFIFLVELIKSNLDVAKRVVSPSLLINPGIVKVKTKLKSPIARLILANSITLTPGTLTVETKDENFYIHWIDVTSPDINEATKQIVQKFEKYLEVIFG